MIHTFSQLPARCAPLMLCDAANDYLLTVSPLLRERSRQLLQSLERYLGAPAPLLAYTRLTGEAWKKTLPATEQTEASEMLAHFRAYLRETGWLDAARPVNQFD